MAEEHEEHKDHVGEHHEGEHKGEHKGEHEKGKHGEHHEGKDQKNKRLLWWGLGLSGAGLLVALLLFNKGGSSTSGQTMDTTPNGFVPNAQNPYDASANEYWPVTTTNPTTGAVTGTTGGAGASTGGTSTSSGSKKKHKGSSSGSKSGSKSKGTPHGTSKTHTGGSSSKVSPHHTVAANPHAGGAHGYVYTVQKGDTLQSLQQKAWPGSIYSNRSGKGKPTSSTNIQTYANNAKILKASGGKLKPGMKINL